MEEWQFCIFALHRKTGSFQKKKDIDNETCRSIWLPVPPENGFFQCGAEGGEFFTALFVSSYCKKERKKSRQVHTVKVSVKAAPDHLSLEGLEVMTHSKYCLAAMESRTLLTSLVKLPSTCLLLNASSSLSSLSMHTGTQCKHNPRWVTAGKPREIVIGSFFL